MKTRSRAGLVLLCGLSVSFVSCGHEDAGSRKPETAADNVLESPVALQPAPAWYAGDEPLSWFVTSGTYETACLKSDSKSTSTHYKSRIRFDGLKVSRVTSFYEDKACRSARLVLGSEAFLSKAYREEPDAKTGLSYLVYFAEERAKLIRNEVYLDGFKASRLNRYKVCKRYWFSNMLNSVLKLSETECRAALADLPLKDREEAELLMQGILPREQPELIHLVFHPVKDGLSVIQGIQLGTDEGSALRLQAVD